MGTKKNKKNPYMTTLGYLKVRSQTLNHWCPLVLKHLQPAKLSDTSSTPSTTLLLPGWGENNSNTDRVMGEDEEAKESTCLGGKQKMFVSSALRLKTNQNCSMLGVGGRSFQS